MKSPCCDCHCDNSINQPRQQVHHSRTDHRPEKGPPRPQICPVAPAMGSGGSPIPPIARNAACAPETRPQRVVLRSEHSALWAVAVASNDSPANRPPLLAVLCRCAAGAKALFQKSLAYCQTGRGSRCRRHWGTQSPEGVDPASRRRGQGERHAPRRECLWAVRRSRSKRPLLVGVAEATPQVEVVTVTASGRPIEHRKGDFSTN